MSDAPACLITGGASGIGEACVQAFAAAGYRVTFGDVQKEKGEALAATLASDVAFVPLDVRSEYEYACSVIQRSVFLGLREAARAMQPRKSGSIVNVASISGLAGGYGPHVYSGCKAAVIAMTRSVALELAESGIRVNAVCPGNIETPIHTGVTDARWVERMARIRPTKRDDQAIDRMGLPSEIAAAVLWLASEGASYVTGQALAVDGGLTAGLPWRRQPAFLRELHLAKKRDL